MKPRLSFSLRPPTNPSFQAGDVVSGTLQISGANSGSVLGELKLQFVGYEEAIVAYTEHRQDALSNVSIVTRQDKKCHYLSKINLPVEHIQHADGTQKVPFSFPIPQGLPSSNDNIIHCVRASLNGIEVQKEIPIQAYSPEPNRVVPYLMNPWTYPMETFFSKHGDISYGCKVLNNRISRGQKLQLKIAVLNSSRATVSQISITVYESIKRMANSHTKATGGPILQHQFPANLTGKHKAKGRSTAPEEERKHARILQELHKPYNHNKLFTLAPLPRTTQVDYKGPCFEVSHSIRVTLTTSGKKYDNISFVLPCTVVEEANVVERTVSATPTNNTNTQASLPVAAAEPIYNLETSPSPASVALPAATSTPTVTTTSSVALPFATTSAAAYTPAPATDELASYLAI